MYVAPPWDLNPAAGVLPWSDLTDANPAWRGLDFPGSEPIALNPVDPTEVERLEAEERAHLAQAELVKRMAIAKGARAERAYRRFADFAREAWPHTDPADLEWNWHHEVFCNHIQWVIEDWIAKRRALKKRGMREVTHPIVNQRANNLLFNVPPGTSKSRFIMVLAHAWIWLKYAPFTIKALSSSPRLATRDGDLALQLISSDWYLSSFEYHRTYDDLGMPWIPNNEDANGKDKAWIIRPDKCGITSFGNTAKGERTAMGFNGKITGERAMALFIDDPHDAKEVESLALRTQVIDRWDTAIWNRVTDMRTDLRIGIMQRLLDGDWSGHILRQQAIDGMPKWCVVIVPATYSVARALPVNVFGYKDPRTVDGELLDPKRLPRKLLAQEKLRLQGKYSGQYDQDPAPEKGGEFDLDLWRFFQIGNTRQGSDPRPKGCYGNRDNPADSLTPHILDCDHLGRPLLDWLDISVDCAFKDLDDGSNVGLSLIGGRQAYRYVFHDWTKARTFRETLRDLLALLDLTMGGKWLFGARPSCPFKVLIEDKANGPAVINMLHAKVPGIVPIQPHGSKLARAQATTPLLDAGQVFLLDGMPWLVPWTYEFSRFPKGEKDDRIDTFSQCLNEHGYADHGSELDALSQL